MLAGENGTDEYIWILFCSWNRGGIDPINFIFSIGGKIMDGDYKLYGNFPRCGKSYMSEKFNEL